ncbi:hypothetical protein ACJ72_06444, partial [Emergomyces africanus]
IPGTSISVSAFSFRVNYTTETKGNPLRPDKIREWTTLPPGVVACMEGSFCNGLCFGRIFLILEHN